MSRPLPPEFKRIGQVELEKRVAQALGLSYAHVKSVIETFFFEIKTEFEERRPVCISLYDFGRFKLQKRNCRDIRNGSGRVEAWVLTFKAAVNLTDHYVKGRKKSVVSLRKIKDRPNS